MNIDSRFIIKGIKALDVLWSIMIVSLFSLSYFPLGNAILRFLILFTLLSISIETFLKGKLVWSYPLAAFTSFIFLVLMTFFYSLSPDLVIMRFTTLVQLGVFFIMIFNYLQSVKRIESTINVLELTGIIIFLLLFISNDLVSSNRAASSLGDVNTVGIFIAFIAGISIWKFLYLKNTFSLFYFVISSSIVFLTGSRTALLVLISVFVSLVSMRVKGLFLKRIIVIGVTLVLVIFFVQNIVFEIPVFYNSIGIRIESMIDILNGRTSSIREQSVQTRRWFSDFGLYMFYQRPLIGWGIESFRFKVGMLTGFYTFAHNNYIELLANVGIIGFSLYYSIFVFIGSRLLKRVSLQKNRVSDYNNSLKILGLALLVGMLISNFFLTL